MVERSGFASVGEVRLHYLEWQGGESVVVCLPGITANAHAFEVLAEELSPRHRLIAMDLRGRGESDKPPSGYDIGAHVNDVVGVLDHLAIRRPAVVGWSLGAKVALALAALHRDRVERLLLIDPPVETSVAAAASLRAFWDRLDNTYRSIDAFLARMRSAWTYTDWSPQVERYLRADVERGPDGLVRHRVPRQVPEAELAAESLYPTRSFYGRVRCPVLVVRSMRPLQREGDQVLTARDARDMVGAILGARLIELADANHFSVLLSPRPADVRPMLAFLDAQQAPLPTHSPGKAPRSAGTGP